MPNHSCLDALHTPPWAASGGGHRKHPLQGRSPRNHGLDRYAWQNGHGANCAGPAAPCCTSAHPGTPCDGGMKSIGRGARNCAPTQHARRGLAPADPGTCHLAGCAAVCRPPANSEVRGGEERAEGPAAAAGSSSLGRGRHARKTFGSAGPPRGAAQPARRQCPRPRGKESGGIGPAAARRAWCSPAVGCTRPLRG